MFVRLCYRSIALIPIEGRFIASISESAHRNNLIHGVTGILIFDAIKFLQVIEGYEDSVETIYTKIKKDPRHFEIELMDYSFVDQILFNFWGMKIASISQPFDLVNTILYESKSKVDGLNLSIGEILKNKFS